MSAVSLAEGTLFTGRYRIVRCIAAGGMGAVYEVTHVETERRRALKVMHPQFLQSQELRDRFRQEARVAAHIESEFIVDVFDAGIDEATQMPFLVMELLRGEELGKLLARRRRLTPTEVVTYLHQAALALDKTHRAQIVHRDLKPENLFVTEREDGIPRIKILDFGIAKVVADSGTNVNATRSIGTPLYMAPEQFRPGHRVSPAADLYALSMMAYTLLVGKTYWADEAAGGNVFAFAGVAMRGPEEAATVRAHRAGVPLPASFDPWFARATAFQPEARYPSATATVAALAEALGLPPPGVGASGPQAPVAASTQVLGAETGSSGAVSRPSLAGSDPGLHGSDRALRSSGPGLHGSAPALHGSGAGLHGSNPGLHGSNPGLHGSGQVAHASGPGSPLHTSGAGSLGGTVPVAQRGSKSPVLLGIAAGLAVCLIVGGAAAYLLWTGGAQTPDGQAAAVQKPAAPEPPAPAPPPPSVEPAPTLTEAPSAAPSASAPKPGPSPQPPLTRPTAAPVKKPQILRD